jgi:hypothetical protein
MSHPSAPSQPASSPGRPPARRPHIEYRFSLAEVLVAVAIDAVLAAAVLEVPRKLRGEKAQVLLVLVFLVYIVVPFVVAPWYLITRRIRRRWPAAWHNRRNDFLISLNFALPLLAFLGQMSSYRGWVDATQLVLLFLPIASTLFMAYSMIVGWMRARSQVHHQAWPVPAWGSAEERRECRRADAESVDQTS